MKPIVTLVLSFFLLVSLTHAQNLVPNANFEVYKSCPTPGNFTPDEWVNPLNPAFGSTPDYFNGCAGTDVGVPTNFVGFQDAATGDGYAGLATYEGTLGFREYIQVKLDSPTEEGACYQLTIVYCPSENAGFSDGLGMFLSVGIPESYTGSPAQMEKTIIQESLTEWHTLTMEYTSPGGETHVTIGNFRTNGDTNHVPNGTQFPNFGYYYIDSVAVELSSSFSDDLGIDLGGDMLVCNSDFPITLTSNLPDSENIWSTGEVGTSIEVNSPGQYYVQTYVPCVYGADTIDISIIPEPVFSVNSETICAGDSVTIQVDESLGDYEWPDGSTGSEFVVSEVGVYGVTLAYTCGEVVSNFFVNEIQDIELPQTQDFQICETELPIVVQYAAFIDGINEFLWSDGSEAPGILITEAGEYGVQVYNQCFADTADFTVDVSLDFPTTVDFIDTIACPGEQKEIIIGFEDVIYEWHDGSSDSSFLANGPGVYSVTVSNYCGIVEFEFEIDEAVEPEFDLGADISICPGDSVLISNPSGVDVSWSTGDTSSQIWVKEGGPIIGIVEGYCANVTDTIVISFDGTAPEISIPDSLLLCAGDTIVISASGSISGVEFMWNTGSESSEIEVFTDGTYIVTGENNCGLVIDSVVVVLGEALPDPNLLDVYEICEGDSIDLTILTNGGSVEWSTGDLDSTISVFEAGTYFVSLTNSCKTKTDSFVVSYIGELSSIDLGIDVGICENGSVILEYTGVNGDYMWSTGEDSESIEVSVAGQYWLEITGTCNLVSDTIEVLDLGSAPIIDLGPDLSFCEGDTVEISVEGSDVDDVIWNTSSIENTISVFGEGTYIVIGSNICGSDSDTIQTVFNNEVPQIDLGTDQIICPGDSVLLETGGVAGDIIWNTGEEGSSIYADETGLYIASLSSSCGESMDSVYVEVEDAAPTIDLGEDVELCEGDMLEFDLDIDEGIDILWNNGDEDGTTNYTESGTIWLELSNYCGDDRDSMELVIIPSIEPFVLPEDVTICDDESYIIEGNISQGEVDLEWNTAEIETSIEVTESAWYWLEATNDCFEFRDSIRVDFYDSAVAFDLGLDDTICSGQSIILSGDQGEAFDYMWQDNSVETDFIVTETGTYVLEVSNECGTFSDEVDILVLQTEEIDNPLNELYVLCNDVPLSIDLSNVIASSILWSDGSTEVERILEEPGVYFVELANACSETIFNFEFEQKNCLTETVFVPNTFSPNDDGVNDYFSISFLERWLSPKIQIQVYNRWGEQIFYSDDPYFKWYGDFKGKSLNPGVYAYYYELEVEIDGERETIREAGDITIIK